MIYSDYNATAPLTDEVREYLIERLQTGPFANPNASHKLGEKVKVGMEKCRELIAETMGASPNQIIFNSGSSEGISQIFHSVCSADPQMSKKDTIIISSIEHSAVSESASYYLNKGYKLRFVPVNHDGIIDIDKLESIIKKESSKIALVSIMAANNETGVIQPLKPVVDICKSLGIVFFSDTTQYIGKARFNFQTSGFDYAVCSGHKLGALTGIGFIMAKNPSLLKPLIHGGGQENRLRGGTQNYIGIESLAIALNNALENYENIDLLNEYRKQFEDQIKKEIPNIVIFGEKCLRAAGTTYMSIPGVLGKDIQELLESDEVFVTTSSACSDNSASISKVLRAMGVDSKLGSGAIRVSVGVHNADEVYLRTYKSLKKALQVLKVL